jgi:cyclopropane fatty-acyl-phospholipid synthase-like methyltransferase
MAEEDPSAEKVGRYYDEWTPRYRSSFGDTFQACRPADSRDLHQYILEQSGIRTGERVLDAGCGVCGPSMYLAKHCDVTIDAVTVSGLQVATARQLIAEAGLESKIAVHLADFHELGEYFPDATFDRVLFLESLSHAVDPAGPLSGVFKVLKPGGVVYIKDFFEKRYDTEAEQMRVREVIDRVDRTFVLRTPSLQHTLDALTRIGFRRQMVERVHFSNDTSVWGRFNDTHSFDLYAGEPPFEWCDWFELRFEKPAE